MQNTTLVTRLALLVGIAAVAGCGHYLPSTKGMPTEQLAIMQTGSLKPPVSINGCKVRPGWYYVRPGMTVVSCGAGHWGHPPMGMVTTKAGVRYAAYVETDGIGSMAQNHMRFVSSDGSMKGGPLAPKLEETPPAAPAR